MVVLDVHDELGERLELETAAPEPAGIGEERSGGDASHVSRRLVVHSPGRTEERRDGGGVREPGWGVSERGGRGFGSGGGSGAERGADTGRAGGQTGTAAGRSWGG